MLEEAVLDVDNVDVETESSSDPVEDEVDAAAAPEPGDRPEQRDTAARRRFLLIEAVSLLVIVGLAVALIFSQVQLSNQNSLNADRASAAAAAKTYAHDVASYSYRHLHRDFGRVESESTPAFRRDFIRSSGSLSKVLVQYKATASAKVLEAGISSISSDKAVVLVFVNQSVANSTQQGASTDDSRIKVTLVRVGGRWLLQDLKVVG
jgi:Mce-associated membrane protein